ncbi:MAG: lysine--tRNA ligase, partial [Phycisphaerales bacterium]|nr:lysine--tRNA ligase [Phycisphaerales bacterium]
GTKAMAPPPEKHAGLQDTELRYRRRYVDLWSNPETMSVFQARSRLVSACRRFMDDDGFVEVETPMLQALAGGAAARPFETHLRALDIPLYLRIAPELYLKRLLVGGMSRVYELNRNFRNEGVDRSHNPEFTVLEVYEAFGDYTTMLHRTEALVRHLAAEVGGGGALPFGELTIDYASPFRQVTYGALFEDALGYPMTDVARARADAKERRLKHEGLADILVVNELFEAVAEPMIDPERPTFVLDYPAALSPLTKAKPDDPAIAERWDLFIGGMEIGPAYTELNDPDVQLERFQQQLQGLDDEESTFRTMDMDFIEALKVGMPPAGGLGLGIDRLVMLMSNQRSIRDVLLFPFMRPLD